MAGGLVAVGELSLPFRRTDTTGIEKTKSAGLVLAYEALHVVFVGRVLVGMCANHEQLAIALGVSHGIEHRIHPARFGKVGERAVVAEIEEQGGHDQGQQRQVFSEKQAIGCHARKGSAAVGDF